MLKTEQEVRDNISDKLYIIFNAHSDKEEQFGGDPALRKFINTVFKKITNPETELTDEQTLNNINGAVNNCFRNWSEDNLKISKATNDADKKKLKSSCQRQGFDCAEIAKSTYKLIG